MISTISVWLANCSFKLTTVALTRHCGIDWKMFLWISPLHVSISYFCVESVVDIKLSKITVSTEEQSLILIYLENWKLILLNVYSFPQDVLHLLVYLWLSFAWITFPSQVTSNTGDIILGEQMQITGALTWFMHIITLKKFSMNKIFFNLCQKYAT